MSTSESTATAAAVREESVRVAGLALRLRRVGAGPPVVVLGPDIGNAGDTPFLSALTGATVLAPAHPGWDGSERPEWLRGARDLAAVYQWLIAELGLAEVSLVGLGFGGWVAAEMASQAPRAFRRLVLVGAMGLKPVHGEILDQALLSYIDYVRAGFRDPAAFDRVLGAEPSTAQLEQWDLNREMCFRTAWKPYMYNPTLPHLLGGVRTPALVVWGRGDCVVPLECGERYAQLLPRARLVVVEDAGHHVALGQPETLGRLVLSFLAERA